jgi:hypothetical protein
MTKEEIERQVIERQMNSYWWGQFMIAGHSDYHEPWQWREALGIRGLYALIGGQEILYIGKATCIGTRIRTHRRDEWMPFSGWSYQDFSDLPPANSPTSKPRSSKNSTPSSTCVAQAT